MSNTSRPRRNFSQKNEILYGLHHFSINPDTREIFLQGVPDNLDEQSVVDYQMATVFLKNLSYLISLNSNPILIHLHTVGGEWDAGMAIYDAIKTCGLETTIIIHGYAYSMGTVILQSATNRFIMPYSSFMVHEGSNRVSGNMREVVSSIEFWNNATEDMINIYAERCKIGPFFAKYTEAKIKKFIKDKFDKKVDWWLNSQDVIKYGFADKIIELKDILPKVGV